MILLLFYFVWLAARRRKSWPRWVLAAALALSLISLAQVIASAACNSTARSTPVSCG
jgi:hypothetical protein